MPSLTSLPALPLEKILAYLCDEHFYVPRRSLRGTTSLLLPRQYPDVHYTLDYANAAHVTLPQTLLSPALASPVLAAAAVSLLGKRLTYLTYLNTEGRLPLWIHAFAKHLKAVSAGVVVDTRRRYLPPDLSALRMKRDCLSVVDMFKEIAVNCVQLHVLDVVHVPFEECGTMQDEFMTGLCATLESSHITLKELALPVYAKSDLCACALETVTLPHLDVFTVELMNVSKPEALSDNRQQRLGRPFLRMMQAVDGHADRSCGLTTLKELRFINMCSVPCTVIEESMRSAGLFRAVRELRVAMNAFLKFAFDEQFEFFALFRKLECLHWNAMPHVPSTFFAFRNLCEKLREVHLCERERMTGVQAGASDVHRKVKGYCQVFKDIVEVSCGKIMTLEALEDLGPVDFRRIPKCCPNLKHLLLYVTFRNLPELRGLVIKCEGLSSLEIVVVEKYERLGSRSWQDLAQAIPRDHANLRDVSIKTQGVYPSSLIPVDAMIDCFEDVVKRLGCHARKLVLRAGTKSRRLVAVINGVSRILDTCRFHASRLTYLDIDLTPRFDRKSCDMQALVDAKRNLRVSTRLLVQWLPNLEQLDLGYIHFYSKFHELSRNSSCRK